MASEVTVTELPECDLCPEYGIAGVEKAAYDANVVLPDGRQTWAYVCETHFLDFGNGLGTGLGQRLVVGERPKGRTLDDYIESGDAPETDEELEELLND